MVDVYEAVGGIRIDRDMKAFIKILPQCSYSTTNVT
jgi:hypothetical protein